jgi:hypothetical protein
MGVWNLVEPGLAITAGNLAVIRPLFRMLLKLLGIRTLPTGLSPPDSRQIFPPTIGARNNNQRRNNLDDTFDLLTRPGEARISGDETKSSYTATVADDSAPNSIRRTSEGHKNESLTDLQSTILTSPRVHGKSPRCYISDEKVA